MALAHSLLQAEPRALGWRARKGHLAKRDFAEGDLTEGDLAIASISNSEPAPAAPPPEGDGVWEDADDLRELLMLPVRMVESLIEAVV